MPGTRSYSSDAFNSLPFRDKLELLYDLSAVEKRDLILGSPEARRLVRSFAPESLFHTLKELGLHDSAELLALASGDQLCALVDLDCWRKDRLDTAALLDWLEVLIEGGSRPLGEFLNRVDFQLLVLFLRRFIRVHRLDEPEDETEDLEGPEIFELDQHYRIEFHVRDARTPLVRGLLEELYERDYSYFVTVMEEVWWGVESELEEDSFQQRNARLQDRGFPDYFEAQDVYRPMAARDLAERSSPLGRSGHGDDEAVPVERSLLVPEDARSFFSEILNAGFDADGTSELRQEMAYLTNRLMVAEGVDFADREAVAEAIRVAHDTVNLGLEQLAGRDRDRAVHVLQHHYVQHLFRFGWSLLLELRKQAKVVAESLGVPAPSGTVTFLDTPYREALSGFARPRPRYFEGIDQPGEIRYRTLVSVDDLERARGLLDDVAAMPALCLSILRRPLAEVVRQRPVGVDDFLLSACLLTAFGHFALGHDPSLHPLSLADLGEVREATIDPATGHLRLDLRGRFLAGAGEAARFLDFCFRRFEEEFLSVSPDRPIDPRFVTCLMVDPGGKRKAGAAAVV